jgi:hypothetical protein
MSSKDESKTEVKFVFDNAAVAHYFIEWLCGVGEQDYFQYMECREKEQDGDITATEFDYWGGTGKNSEFGKNDIIAICGRLDRKE